VLGRKRFAAWAGAIFLTVGLPIAIDQGYVRYNPYILPLLGLAGILLYLVLAVTSSFAKTTVKSFHGTYPRTTVTVIIFMCICVITLLGTSEWYSINKSITYTQHLQEADNSPDKNYFTSSPPEIRTATEELTKQFGTDTQYVIFTNMFNASSHIVTHLYYRIIIINTSFGTLPTWDDGSIGNDIPAKTGFDCHVKINFHPPVEASYIVFTIKYHYRFIPFTKYLCQTWYYKTPQTNSDISSLHLAHTSIPEQKNIYSHVSEQLKDYCE
jgi:hypothetical protein